jgi:hypothetical protein
MIEHLATRSPDQIEFRFSGDVKQSDYETTLIPAVETALETQDTIRILVIFDESFSGFDLGAAWSDTKMGLSHWRGFDRVAVATDLGWLKIAMQGFAPLAPCPVRSFPLDQADDARRWLRESLGAVHITDLGGRAIQVQLLGQLDPDAIRAAEGELDRHISERGGFRLLLDLREFDGWQGVSALGAHFHLVRTHAGDADRIAVVGDKTWQNMAQRMAGRILDVPTQFFEPAQMEAAKVWLAQD